MSSINVSSGFKNKDIDIAKMSHLICILLISIRPHKKNMLLLEKPGPFILSKKVPFRKYCK